MRLTRPLLHVLFVTSFALLAACQGATPTTPTPTTGDAASPTPVNLALRVVPASSDLAVGKNRIVFALLDSRNAPVQASAVEMTIGYVQNGQPVEKGTVQAVFRRWPSGPGGVFTTDYAFDQPGTWFAEVTPVDGPATEELARTVLQVKEQSATPALGEPAPASDNRTAADVPDLEQLTSDIHADPELYQMTIAEALAEGKPLLVTFATPAFCSSQTCGPQVDVVKGLKEDYQGRANFIHIEIYANPHEVREDPSKGVVAETVTEWNLPSEPWTFVVDANGNVAAKFEGFVSREELEPALQAALG